VLEICLKNKNQKAASFPLSGRVPAHWLADFRQFSLTDRVAAFTNITKIKVRFLFASADECEPLLVPIRRN
jgi:hypothetical protein